MALGRPPLGRRALTAATLGAIYGLLLLPRPEAALGVSVLGIAWFLLSMGLLFLTPLAYHAFTLFGLLWVVWRGVVQFSQPDPQPWAFFALDLAFPLAALVLLMTSPYLERARATRPPPEAQPES